MRYSQYGEEQVLNTFFGEHYTNGFLIDVGAMDGITYSNSRYLIKHKAWSGVLVEPHPEYFEQLKKLYENMDNIKLLNFGCYNREGESDFYLYATGIDGSVSTMSEEFKKHVEHKHGDRYGKQVKIKLQTLDNIMKDYTQVDFLSIDVEGVDMEVLMSNNWSKNKPRLICVEHSMDLQTLINFMNSVHYSKYAQTAGNTFFTRNEV